MNKTAFSAFVGGVAVASLAVGFLAVAQWSGPTGAPPTNNVETPLHEGTPEQWKDAGLEVNLTNFNTTGLKVHGYLQLDTLAGAPPGADCAVGFEGRAKFDTSTNTLYICNGTSWIPK